MFFFCEENASEKDKNDFLDEMQVMMTLGTHPHVVELLGCCTKSEGNGRRRIRVVRELASPSGGSRFDPRSGH